MIEQNKANKLMDEATDKAAATVKGVNFSDTNAVLDEFNSKIDQASELASAKAKQNNKSTD